MKQFLVFFSFLGMIFAISPTYAQPDEAILAKLANISTSPAVMDKVTSIFAHDESKLSTCQKMSRPVPSGISVFDLPVFRGEALSEGTWQTRYELSVCGKKRFRTALFKVENGVDLTITSLLPGSTLADMWLQKDVRDALFLAVSAIAPTCQKPFITHTQVVEHPADAKGPWQEIWTAEFCGKKVAQTINFIPNEEGTTFFMTAIRR